MDHKSRFSNQNLFNRIQEVISEFLEADCFEFSSLTIFPDQENKKHGAFNHWIKTIYTKEEKKMYPKMCRGSQI